MNHITMAAKASHFEIVFHNITTRYYNKEYAMYVAHSIKWTYLREASLATKTSLVWGVGGGVLFD